MHQELLTTSARRLAGIASRVPRNAAKDFTASLKRPDIAVWPGVCESSTAWSSNVALGAAIDASKAHIVPWWTGCLPGLVPTPAGVKLFAALSLGDSPL